MSIIELKEFVWLHTKVWKDDWKNPIPCTIMLVTFSRFCKRFLFRPFLDEIMTRTLCHKCFLITCHYCFMKNQSSKDETLAVSKSRIFHFTNWWNPFVTFWVKIKLSLTFRIGAKTEFPHWGWFSDTLHTCVPNSGIFRVSERFFFFSVL